LNLNQLGNIRRLLSVPLQQRSGDCAPVSIFIGMDDTVMLWSIRSRFIPKLSAGAFRLCEAEMHPYNLTSDPCGRKKFGSFDHLDSKIPGSE